MATRLRVRLVGGVSRWAYEDDEIFPGDCEFLDGAYEISVDAELHAAITAAADGPARVLEIVEGSAKAGAVQTQKAGEAFDAKVEKARVEAFAAAAEQETDEEAIREAARAAAAEKAESLKGA